MARPYPEGRSWRRRSAWLAIPVAIVLVLVLSPQDSLRSPIQQWSLRQTWTAPTRESQVETTTLQPSPAAAEVALQPSPAAPEAAALEPSVAGNTAASHPTPEAQEGGELGASQQESGPQQEGTWIESGSSTTQQSLATLDGKQQQQQQKEADERSPATTPAAAATTSGCGCEKLLWITAMGGRTAKDRLEYYRAALLSAREHAPSLVPVLIYSGQAGDFTDWVAAAGGHVVNHTLSFLHMFEELREQDTAWGEELVKVQGVWLRLDVPLVVARLVENAPPFLANTSSAYALYTDTDVMFLPGQDISTCVLPLPALFAIGPEHARGVAANTGVMAVNVHGFAQEVPAMLQFAQEGQFKFPAMDQGMVLAYMAHKQRVIELLPDRFNWKGYWGSDPDAAIFHWHGPKPRRCLPCYLAHRAQPDWPQQCEAEEQQAKQEGFSQLEARCAPFLYLLQMCPDGGDLYASALEQFEGYQQENR